MVIPMALVKSALFVDGENITFRFQEMEKAGRTRRPRVTHRQDVYLWNEEFGDDNLGPHINTDIFRVKYYTSVVGDDALLKRVRVELSKQSYWAHGDFYGRCQVHPEVYKKPKQRDKSRQVDINITVDMMRHAYNNDVDVLYLFSGDGDFLHLIEDVMRRGKKVCVGAFSDGLNPAIPYSVDRFFSLDDLFFLPIPSPATADATEAGVVAETAGQADP
jgi:uncharacterized LabA/DUF88 family protein